MIHHKVILVKTKNQICVCILHFVITFYSQILHKSCNNFNWIILMYKKQ